MDDVGVDLNRNYGFKFAYDDVGSDYDPCDNTYRGSAPFSEPETRAMRDFLIALPKVRIAVNFHAPGPLFITPFCFDEDARNPLLASADYLGAKKFYDHAISAASLPDFYKTGPAISTIEYTANGEASDFMLGELGIYALTVELGSDKEEINEFFIKDAADLKTLLLETEPWTNEIIDYILEVDWALEDSQKMQRIAQAEKTQVIFEG